MKMMKMLLIAGLLILSVALALSAEENEEAVYNYWFWVGSHYTDFQDYTRKVGEYNIGNSEFLPEFMFDFNALKGDGYYTFSGHYYDEYNIDGKFTATKGDRLNVSLQLRSLIHKQGQDLLENMETREWKTSAPGGKILTHEITDPNADYYEDRKEILTKVSLLLSEKNRVRFIAAHRSILEKGKEQKIASDHCFSCHLASQTTGIDKATHQVDAGIEAEAGNFDFGYMFGYHKFASSADDLMIYYDSAAHPGHGGAGPEFSSRMIFEDTTVNYSIYPETEKMSHKVKVNGNVGKGRFAGSFGYSKAENKKTSLSTNAVSGAVNYTVPLSPKTRLYAKVAVVKRNADDTLIDLPVWRPQGDSVDFDYTRYSSLDRMDNKASVEVNMRLNPRFSLSLLGGFHSIKRYDYPEQGANKTSSTLIGQLKARYRKGMKFSGMFKYRFEKTKDPFTSGKGLFEAMGRYVLEPKWNGYSFYYQREDLRYQDITTFPTDLHRFEIKAMYKPDMKYSFNFGLRTTYDKNGDLDSLDVNHFSLQPNVNLTVTPNQRFAVTTGYSYNYYKSRGPVTVALFDG